MKLLGLLLILLFSRNSFAQTGAGEGVPEKTKLDTNREVIRTYAKVFLESNDYVHAEQMISEYLVLDSVDGNLWILLGQAQMKQRKLAQACYSFQKASSLNLDRENKLYSTYLFADCLNEGNRMDEAKVVLKKMVTE